MCAVSLELNTQVHRAGICADGEFYGSRSAMYPQPHDKAQKHVLTLQQVQRDVRLRFEISDHIVLLHGPYASKPPAHLWGRTTLVSTHAT